MVCTATKINQWAKSCLILDRKVHFKTLYHQPLLSDFLVTERIKIFLWLYHISPILKKNYHFTILTLNSWTSNIFKYAETWHLLINVIHSFGLQLADPKIWILTAANCQHALKWETYILQSLPFYKILCHVLNVKLAE